MLRINSLQRLRPVINSPNPTGPVMNKELEPAASSPKTPCPVQQPQQLWGVANSPNKSNMMEPQP